MDMSKDYVLMCRKYYEIKNNYKVSSGDFYFDYRVNEVLIWHKNFMDETDYDPEQGYLWDIEFCIYLPRQDQLQIMVQCETIYNDKFNDWVNEPCNDMPFKSMEQLWLAFVMKENFNKVWDGSDWIFQKGSE